MATIAAVEHGTEPVDTVIVFIITAAYIAFGVIAVVFWGWLS